ncbi:MAG: glycosyltransferase [Armatimonadetes bacterium]|nr:glycosyltransferase [Armatimonadota bacterium]
MNRRLSVVQVNTIAEAGGAARVARDLHEGLVRAGDRSHLVVGRKRSADDSVQLLENNKYRDPWSRLWLAAQSALEQMPVSFKGKDRLGPLLGDIALPTRAMVARRGLDYFGYPAAWHPEDWAASAELVHLHNLHGGYFDLRALPMLTARYPTVLTLHDAWLLSGHCAHSFDCERWKTGCGECPDLSIPPAVKRDETARNWRAKRAILAASKLYVASPSRWLMEKVEASILAPAVAEARVIPNGIDREVFRPQDKGAARRALHLPDDARILVFAAHGGSTGRWKDFATIETAALEASRALGGDVILVAIGGRSGSENRGNLRLHYIPHVTDRERLARYLVAADACVHAVHADNFPLWVCEALACGTPVVSVRVGGIPEVVQDGVTGLLVGPQDVASFSRALVTLLGNDELRNRMGEAASEYAARHLGRDRMVEDYRHWYEEILSRRDRFSRQTAGS